MESLASVLSIILVLLIEIESVPRIILSLVAAAIAIAIAIGKIGRFGEKWQLYRLASEALASETQLYLHHARPYAAAPDGADQLLVERVEALLSRAAVVWHRLTAPDSKQIQTLS